MPRAVGRGHWHDAGVARAGLVGSLDWRSAFFAFCGLNPLSLASFALSGSE